jgi:polyhydroxyalkanoate synthesis regulator phasin
MPTAPEERDAAPEPPRAEQSVQAFRDALEKSVTISRERLQEVVDDAVKRGRMTRGDAEEMVSRLATRGREQAEELLSQLDGLLSQTVARVDKPLASVDRVRRGARVPGFPITAYDQLSIPQIDRRLQELSPQELRKVRDYERKNKARKGLLRALDRKLGN